MTKLNEAEILVRSSDEIYTLELLPKAGDSLFLIIQCIEGERDHGQLKQEIVNALTYYNHMKHSPHMVEFEKMLTEQWISHLGECKEALKLKELVEKECKEFVTSGLNHNYKITPRGYGRRLERLLEQSKADSS